MGRTPRVPSWSWNMSEEPPYHLQRRVRDEGMIGCQVLLMVKGEGAQERWLGLVTSSWRLGQESFLEAALGQDGSGEIGDESRQLLGEEKKVLQLEEDLGSRRR